MGRRMDVSRLVGAVEIANRTTAAGRQTVHSWIQRDATFPAPVLVLAMGNLWDWAEVETWAKRTGRLPKN